jgi:hypothetical protein
MSTVGFTCIRYRIPMSDGDPVPHASGKLSFSTLDETGSSAGRQEQRNNTWGCGGLATRSSSSNGARARHARRPADPATGIVIFFSAFWSESPKIVGLWSDFPLIRDRNPFKGIRESRGGLKSYVQSKWALARRLRVFSSRSDKTLAPKRF